MGTGRKIWKRILELTVRPVLKNYLSSDREYTYKNLRLTVYKGVFHPGFFFSTRLFLKFLDAVPVKDRLVLELGAGSGLISLVMAAKGASVTASDISETAVRGIKRNAARNGLTVNAVHSDLLGNIHDTFDLILINPPYYPSDPEDDASRAWYCGKDFDYFKRLFIQLPHILHPRTEIYMILSEDCRLDRIMEIASAANFEMEEVYRKNVAGEQSYIFSIKKKMM